ncbi:MAG TPA: hypothetical protein VMS64_18625 [Candidatus Methylomirabilis sp.]|nr:hypothetical protein [Candidatus Methylomirabilis sp.]
MKTRATLWVTCAVLLMAGAVIAQSDDQMRVFDATLDRVWLVTRTALRGLGWDIEKEDRAAGWLITDSRVTEGDDFGVYAKGTKHRLRLVFKTLSDGKVAVTVEHRVWKEQRILWMDKREDLSTTDHQVEKELLDTIGATL